MWGPEVGGIVVHVDDGGDDAARPLGPGVTCLHLAATPVAAPLRLPGVPVHEADSWAAFVDDERLTLCLKSAALEPPEFLRVELPRTGLDGRLLVRAGYDAAPVLRYPADQLLLVHALTLLGGALIHGAGVVGAAGAFLAVGPSGTGKTTLARAAHAAGARILSDERTVVRPTPDGWVVAGTPWPGEGGFADTATVPLRGLLLLEQAEADALEPLTPARALALLYRCHFPPLWDATASARTLDNLAALVRAVPAHRLRNRKGPEVAALVLGELGGPP